MRYLQISILLLSIGYFGLLNPVRDVVVLGLTPIQFGLKKTALDIKQVFSFFKGVNSIRKENLDLTQKNLELEQRVFINAELQKENDLLRAQLNFASKEKNKQIVLLANIIGNPNDPSSSIMFIDKGSRDEVRTGDFILVGANLLGTVKSVDYSRSTVELLRSSSMSFTVYDIDSPSKTEGLGVGKHGSIVSMERILQGEKVSIGDMIVTSGKDGLFPPELLVGKIVQIYDDPSQPLKTADVQQFVDFSKVNQVFVVRGK